MRLSVIFIFLLLQTDYQHAELTNFKIGTFIKNLADDIGLTAKTQHNEVADLTAVFDNDFETSIQFCSQDVVEISIATLSPKDLYPSDGFFISNGDVNGIGRIRTLQIVAHERRKITKWTYSLHDTLQWHYVRFPRVFWFSKSTRLVIKPIDFFDNTRCGRISQLAFDFE